MKVAALALSYEESYEALNLVDGQRSTGEIWAWLVAEFGHVELEDVADYLAALEKIRVIL